MKLKLRELVFFICNNLLLDLGFLRLISTPDCVIPISEVNKMSREVYTANLLKNMRRDKKIITARFISTGVRLMRRVCFKVLQPKHSRIDQCRSSGTGNGSGNGAAQKRAASGMKSHIKGFHFMNSLMWGKDQMVPPMHRPRKNNWGVFPGSFKNDLVAFQSFDGFWAERKMELCRAVI